MALDSIERKGIYEEIKIFTRSRQVEEEPLGDRAVYLKLFPRLSVSWALIRNSSSAKHRIFF